MDWILNIRRARTFWKVGGKFQNLGRSRKAKKIHGKSWNFFLERRKVNESQGTISSMLCDIFLYGLFLRTY